ncbi:MAG: DegT/DnrJ/EryC1/StrS family aminotransferase [Planctomycetota bacterium]|nr:DegT/DnrJ/EryC1/StrS family aminotransferase [Planctomycetota bacterium]
MPAVSPPPAAPAIHARLAALGGPKAVTIQRPPWPWPNEAEIQAVLATLRKAPEDIANLCSARGGGPGEALEARMKRDLGVPYAIATCGGGPALHIACMCALEAGDEAIVSPYTWGQTVSCILQAGGVPVFADIDPETLTLDPDAVAARITPRTKAIVAVHLGGIPAEMDRLAALAEKHGLCLIEDCAQAQGSRYRGRSVGSFGHFGCFSFGSTKNIAAGDAGMLVTRDRGLYERALLTGMHPNRTTHEIEDPERRRWIDSLIYTYRVNVMSAALALAQFDRLEELNAWRRANARALVERLRGVPGIRALRLPERLDPAWHSVHFVFVPEEVPGVTRSQYVQALSAEGVPIFTGYDSAIHLRPAFQEKRTHFGRGFPWSAHPRGGEIVYRAGDCPVAERRCGETGLTMLGGWSCRDIAPLLDQIGVAFRKVAAQLDQVARLDPAPAV